MPDTFEIEIATPERRLFQDRAIRAQIPAKDGYIGVLPDHAPLLSILGVGVLTYTTQDNQHHVMAVRGGFLEIIDNHVRVLPDKAEKAPEIDVAQAEKELKDAEAALVDPSLGIDIAAALIGAEHSRARIDAANKQKSGEE
jgi:F-type H+-transporting ATPase subunit epsilon